MSFRSLSIAFANCVFKLRFEMQSSSRSQIRGLMCGPSTRCNPSFRPTRVLVRRSRPVISVPKSIPLCRDNPPQPDVPKDRRAGRGGAWLKRLFSRFAPATDRSKTTLVLDFEKPLINLDNRIKEVVSFVVSF